MNKDDVINEVVNAISRGSRTNAEIQITVLGEVDKSGYSRPIDVALQKLRKRGEIVVVGGKWFMADQKPCTRCHGTGKEPR